jgi:hypothetical protein
VLDREEIGNFLEAVVGVPTVLPLATVYAGDQYEERPEARIFAFQ